MTPVQRCGRWLVAILGLWLGAGAGCGEPGRPATSEAGAETGAEAGGGSPPKQPPPPPSAAAPLIHLVDTAAEAGLQFVHRSGDTGRYRYPEIITGGACLADFDGDGHLDAYLPQGGVIPGDEPAGDSGSAANRLFLGRGDGRFRDHTAASGAGDSGYGNGAFAADIDGDGDLDLLLTNTGGMVLLRNRGDASF